MTKPTKPSGQDFRKAKRKRVNEERARLKAEQEAGTALTPALAERCADPLKSHLYELQRLTDLQHQLDTTPSTGDAGIGLERRIALATQIANAIARLRVDAELTLKMETMEREFSSAREELDRERAAISKERHKRFLPARLYNAVKARAEADKANADDIIARAIETYCAAHLKEYAP